MQYFFRLRNFCRPHALADNVAHPSSGMGIFNETSSLLPVEARIVFSATAVCIDACLLFQCPLFDFWQNIIVDMKLEVVNTDTDITSHTVYWISSVKAVAGNSQLIHIGGVTITRIQNYRYKFFC